MNVLLVDDELLLLQGLKQQIEDFELPIHIIGLAGNAEQAMAILCQHEVQLVISDIHMPKINGLELAEQIKAQYPAVSVILLSGYAEFEYARRAIHLGVAEYLTKPLNETLLQQTLERHLDRYQADLIERKKSTLLRYLQVKDSVIMPAHLMPLLQEPAPSKTYCCIWLHLFQHVSANVNAAIKQLAIPLDCGLPGSTAVVVTDQDDEAMKRQLTGLAEIYTLVYSSSLTWEQLPVQFGLQKKLLLEQASPWKAHRMDLNFDRPESDKQSAERIDRRWEGIISHSKLGAAIELWRQWYEDWLSQPPSWQIFLAFGEMIMKSPADDEEACKRIHQIQAEIKQGLQQAELRPWKHVWGELNRLAHDLIEVSCSQINSSTALVRQTKSLLRDHWNETLTLEQLAQQLYVSPSYLGKTFKRIAKQSISEYVMKLRMEQAKELLSVGTLKAIDVAVFVGYDDYRYFSKLFRKYTGMLPSEFTPLS